MKFAASSLVALAFLPALAFGIETKGSIESVTVYRGQALVTRLVQVPAAKAVSDAAGTVQEVIITDLPTKVRPDSVHAEGSDEVKVRSVRFRQRPVVQDTREEVRKLDAKIETAADLRGFNQRKIDLINEHRAVLTSMQNFVAPTATVELTRGVLNAETLQKLTAFVREQRSKMWEEEATLGSEVRRLSRELEQLQRERQDLTAGSSKTVYEAVVLVSGDPGAMRLRYLVDDANWTPSYNIRAAAGTPGEREVTLEYYASINQMSGEDWGSVTMTLSTATPSLTAKAPTLSAMTIMLTSTQQQAEQGGQLAYADARRELEGKQRKAENIRASNTSLGAATKAGGRGFDDFKKKDEELDKSLNEFANSIQVLDLVAAEKVVRESGASRHTTQEGLSVTYLIPGKTSMPSRSDQQLIQVAALPMKAHFSKLATPVLTGYVYDEARLVNTSTIVLLAGPVTGYLDGAFVGSGDLPTVAVGEEFTAGFGIDSSLRAQRELVERAETIQGGNRVVELTYRLKVENFGTAPALVQLMDRLPKVRGGGGGPGSDIRVTLISTNTELSKAEDFVKTQQKDGILRWDLPVPAKTIGTGAAVEYKFRLEYDKQMNLVGMGG